MKSPLSQKRDCRFGKKLGQERVRSEYMKDMARARLAGVVGAASRNKNITSVYDYNSSSHRNISVKLTNGKVTGYDYESSSHFSGGSNGKLDYYDYDTSSHVQLKIDGNKFSGYDYHTSQHFSGTINSSSISIYDYETSQHYNFSV